MSTAGKPAMAWTARGLAGAVLWSACLLSLSSSLWANSPSMRTGKLAQARAGHTATLLADGTVLITGGRRKDHDILDSVEVFDPQTLRSTLLSAELSVPRTEHTATLLPTGETLLAGGRDTAGVLFTTELFQRDGSFHPLPATVQVPRAGHTATLLPDGRVLILGGLDASRLALESGESFEVPTGMLYDPRNGHVTLLPHALAVPRHNHTATLLPTGQVLVVGGRQDDEILDSAELVDPATGESRLLDSHLQTGRLRHTASLLNDGRVLTAGGRSKKDALDSVEVFDPAAQTFATLRPKLREGRFNHTATVLPAGDILIAGGRDDDDKDPTRDTELYSQPGQDTTPPTVLEVTPANDATGISRTPLVAIRFSEPIRVTTLTGATLTLTGPQGPVPGTVSPGESGLLAFFVPAAPLAEGTTYTLRLSGLTDRAGNPLLTFTSSFATVLPAPTLTGVTPSSGPIGTVVQLTGTNFVNVQSVTFNGVPASSFTVSSPTALTATVPPDATSGPVTVTTPGGTASSAAPFTVLTAPTITSFTPAQGPVGTPVMITGTNFVNVQSVTLSGVPAQTVSVTSPSALTATVPAGATTGLITVTTPQGSATSAAPFIVTNAAPVLAPIGNKTVPLGSTLAFTVAATDPESDLVTFAVTPVPLPAHAAFNAQTGEFMFTPDASQVGTFMVTIVASDGAHMSSETITLTVPGAPPGGATALTGRVDDTARQPVSQVIVALKGTSLSTLTDAQGQFTLTGIPETQVGRQQVVVTGFTQGYANLVAPVDLIANVTNQLPQPLTLPPVDMTTAVPVNPNAATVVQSTTLNVAVTIPPHTAKNADGTEYTGVLTISPVPEYGRVESRPAELRPGLSITIQPAGVVLDPPVPITFPNVDGMAPGNELDLWSLSPDTGTFLQVGVMRVSADGQRIETISGGVRKTAWHFALAPGPAPVFARKGETGTCTACTTGSQSDLEEGALSLDLPLASVRSVGVSRDLRLHYRSTTADVRPILPLDASLPVVAAVPQTFSARLTVGGLQQGGDLYWNAAGLPEDANSVSRLGLPWDASQFPTGRYRYEAMLFSNYPQSSIGGGLSSLVLVRNERESSLGAGWLLAGLDRVLPQPDGAVLLASGEGALAVFEPAARPLVIESVGVGRAGGVTADPATTFSFLGGTGYGAAKNDLLDPANFGPTGIVRRPVQFRSGLQTITTAALAGVDVIIYGPLSSPLTPTEAVGLEEFLQEGGALLQLGAFNDFDPPILGTDLGGLVCVGFPTYTGVGLTSVLRQGPFGTAPAGTLFMGCNWSYTLTGSTTAVATNGAGPDLLLLQPGPGFGGTGRAVLIGDEDIFGSNLAGPWANYYSVNRTLFLNTMAFLAEAPGFRPAPAPPGSSSTLTGPPGDFSTLTKNPDGTFTRTLKDRTRYDFNAQGLQTTVTDRNGNQTTYAYDADGRLLRITDPVGLITTFSYSGGRLQAITDPAGRVTQLQHDGDGNLTRVTYADSTTQQFVYDPQRRMTQRTDARSQVTHYQYDHAGRLTQVTLPTGAVRKITPSQLAAVPNLAAGEGTQANPAPLAPAGNTARFTDARGNATVFELDALSRVSKQTDALNRATTIQRDAQGNPTRITRPNSAVTTMTYDAKGNLLTTNEQAIAATTTFTYEPTFNQVTSVQDPKNNTTTIGYDAKGNPTQITDADGKVTTLAYDPRGLLTTTTDALGQTTTFTYDSLGRLLTTTDPLGRTTTLAYDAAGNVATNTDALGRVTRFTYDPLNRLTQVTDPASGVTRYAYDGNGNLVTVTDAKGQVTTYAYDALNRLASTTDPLGKTETYTYDGADNLTTRVTPRNETITFVYDAVNQLLSKTLPGNLVTSYAYDSVGNLSGVTDPDSVLAMTYDLANRLTIVSTTGSPNQPAVALSYTYDKNGNRLMLANPTGTNSYSYDPLNRLSSLTSPAGTTTYAYDTLSRRTSMSLPNGTQTTYSYDPASQVTNILHKITATNAPINEATYTYNNVGNRTSLGDKRGTQSFSYDALDRLTSATHPLTLDQTFAYDPVGNRTTNSSQHNTGNQLTEDSGFTYQYDANGNLIRKTVKASGVHTDYTYDAENRLVKVEEFAAGATVPTATSTYRYDGLGRRIEKVGNGLTRRFIYDGEDILLEYDETNTLLARYTHGPGIDEPIAMTRGGSIFFYLQDGFGTVTELTEGTGTTAQSYVYDAWGNIVQQTGNLENPYTYTGREFDPETGLYYYRARYYDPVVGRFLNKDPIGFSGGDTTLYSYVSNRPTYFIDPTGTERVRLDSRHTARIDKGAVNSKGTEITEYPNAHILNKRGNDIGRVQIDKTNPEGPLKENYGSIKNRHKEQLDPLLRERYRQLLQRIGKRLNVCLAFLDFLELANSIEQLPEPRDSCFYYDPITGNFFVDTCGRDPNSL